jgi:hypothetical protein
MTARVPLPFEHLTNEGRRPSPLRRARSSMHQLCQPGHHRVPFLPPLCFGRLIALSSARPTPSQTTSKSPTPIIGAWTVSNPRLATMLPLSRCRARRLCLSRARFSRTCGAALPPPTLPYVLMCVSPSPPRSNLVLSPPFRRFAFPSRPSQRHPNRSFPRAVFWLNTAERFRVLLTAEYCDSFAAKGGVGPRNRPVP